MKSITIGGKKLNGFRIAHRQLMEGKTLKMQLK
ncbi:hypothetical protein [Prevotella sp.]|nr:hypothetical protein [Prevotella sp.]